MGNKMDYISTLIDLNILCLLDLVWWSHLFSPWWDLQKIILFTNLFSVSIWFTKCDDGGSNFASSWWPHFYRLTLRHVIAMLLMSVGLWSFKLKGAKLFRFLSYLAFENEATLQIMKVSITKNNFWIRISFRPLGIKYFCQRII